MTLPGRQHYSPIVHDGAVVLRELIVGKQQEEERELLKSRNEDLKRTLKSALNESSMEKVFAKLRAVSRKLSVFEREQNLDGRASSQVLHFLISES